MKNSKRPISGYLRLFKLAIGLTMLGLSLAASAEAKPITITATFLYHGPDGTDKPIRWAWCQLRDSDILSDDVIAESVTDESGTVTFTYDSGLDDGWLGGRIDPYVRCYARLMIALDDRAYEKAAVVKKRRMSITNAFQPAYYEVNTPVWDDNDGDRTASITDTTDDRYAFFLMDCVAEANARRQKPGTPFLLPAPVALQGDICRGQVNIVYPAALTTGFQNNTMEIWIESKYKDDFDTVVHEYGHHEMWEVYGGSLFGDFDMTQNDHGFSTTQTNNVLSVDGHPQFADADWTAFAEAWADFSAVIAKGYPVYRMFNLELDDVFRSARCEGTICHIFWDIWDTYADRVADENKAPIDRPQTGRDLLDDDPFGFRPAPPYSAMPGRNDLKSVIKNSHPKSLAGFKAAWDQRYAHNPLVRRALESVFWRNGVRTGIIDEAPVCALAVEGTRLDDTFQGGLTLKAAVTDMDDMDATPSDGQLMHVTFYWSYYSSLAKALNPPERQEWHVIGSDFDGKDGFSCVWPADAADKPDEARKVYITAIASDFFQDSAYGLADGKFTQAQVGPVLIKKGTQGTAGGAGTGNAKPEGPLTEVGYLSLGFATGLKASGTILCVANWTQGLRVVDISEPESPRLYAFFKPTDVSWTDYCEDVDLYEKSGPGGKRRLYAVVAWGSAGLRIVDVTAPSKPVQVGFLKSYRQLSKTGKELPSETGIHPSKVRVYGSTAYFWYGKGLNLVDISDVNRPKLVRSYRTKFEIVDLVIVGDYAYLACSEAGLRILDLREEGIRSDRAARSTETLPETMIIGSAETRGRLMHLAIHEDADSRRRYAVLAEVAHKGRGTPSFRVIDVTDPGRPEDVAGFDLPASPDCIAMAGPRALVGGGRGITVFDLSDGLSPKKVCHFKGNFVYSAYKILALEKCIIVLVAEDHLGLLRASF